MATLMDFGAGGGAGDAAGMGAAGGLEIVDGEELVEILGEDVGEPNPLDVAIGALEDAMVDESLELLRTGFLREHCHHFEATEENKLVYMQLFQQYQTLVESELESRLRAAVPGFNMSDFLEALGTREDLLDSDMFDLLLSFSEFSEFKELMLAFRDEGSLGNFGVHVISAPLREEDDTAGEPRPDLEGGLLHVHSLPSPDRVGGAGTAAGMGFGNLG